jgi:membrane protein involved in colicin uptake
MLAALCFVNLVNAQVHRCQDASGKLAYSDKPCAPGQQGAQIERQKTREEIFQERETAYNAEMRKQQRNMVERQQEQMERQRALQNMPAAAPRDPGADWAARKTRENAATSAGSITNNGGQWDRAAEAERDRVRQEEARKRSEALAREQARAQAEADAMPKPTRITSCIGYNCWDDKGNSYSRATGSQKIMTGPNGQQCQLIGSTKQWQCQ